MILLDTKIQKIKKKKNKIKFYNSVQVHKKN